MKYFLWLKLFSKTYFLLAQSRRYKEALKSVFDPDHHSQLNNTNPQENLKQPQ